MMARERTAVALAAVALAYQLKVNEFDPLAMGALREKAERLPTDDPLLRAITSCAVQMEVARRADWPQLGAQLQHAIDLAMQPVPPDLERADIHG